MTDKCAIDHRREYLGLAEAALLLPNLERRPLHEHLH